MNQEELKSLLNYDPETGVFIWKISPKYDIPVGSVAGCTRHDGYLIFRIKGESYLGHRLAWLYMTGEWPSDLVDHINQNPSDTRWGNLRAVDHSANHMNGKVLANNTSRCPNVYWNKKSVKWFVKTAINKVQKTHGSFTDHWDAVCCAKSIHNKLGYHVNHGRV